MEMKTIKILSLFDGISIARQAILNCGMEIDKYYASEIDKYAIQIAQKNFPDTIQVGSVVDLKGEDFKDIDLIIGGSPCQDLSIAKNNRQGLSGARSGLFYEYANTFINNKIILNNRGFCIKPIKFSKTISASSLNFHHFLFLNFLLFIFSVQNYNKNSKKSQLLVTFFLFYPN